MKIGGYMPVIPALRKLRLLLDWELKPSLGHITGLCLYFKINKWWITDQVLFPLADSPLEVHCTYGLFMILPLHGKLRKFTEGPREEGGAGCTVPSAAGPTEQPMSQVAHEWNRMLLPAWISRLLTESKGCTHLLSFHSLDEISGIPILNHLMCLWPRAQNTKTSSPVTAL